MASRQEIEKLFSEKETTVIPEVSGNHCGSLKRAMKIILAAKNSGCKFIKFQTYEASSITIPCKSPDFTILDKESLWYEKNLYELYDAACTPLEWQRDLFQYSRDLGLIPFSSPFCPNSVEVLESLDCPIYKVASFEVNNLPLLKEICRTGKPIILSTGVSSLQEIDRTIDFICKHNADSSDLMLMKCTSKYPASLSSANVSQIKLLRDRYGCSVGYSDHTIGLTACLTAAALGAASVEKHFTLEHDDNNIDGAFSAGIKEMTELVTRVKGITEALGSPTEWNFTNSQFKRSIYVKKDIQKGQSISMDNIMVARPSYGGDAYDIFSLIGRKSLIDAKMGDRFFPDMCE